MTFDPRTKPLAEGLYPERTGKTTRVVADIAARDAIAAGDKYDGLLVQVLGTRKLYSWDAAGSAWVAVTASSGAGIPKFADLTALQAATGMTDGDFAVTLDTNKLYQYVDSAWVEFTSGGGGGGGIPKYATLADIRAVVAPAEGDMALALDTGITMQYRNGTWVSAFNSFVDPNAQSGWVLERKIKCVAGVVPTGVIDISNCDKFRVEVETHSTPSSGLYLYFDGDSGSNYELQVLQSQNATTTSAKAAGTYGVMLVSTTTGQAMLVTEFDRRNKMGVRTRSLGGTAGYLEFGSIRYIGSTAMSTLTFAGTGSFGGYISVYKWVDGVKPLELVTYELVKEYKLSNQVLDDTLPWDGEVDDELFITADLLPTATSTNILCVLNGDAATANYPFTGLYGSGTATSSSNGTAAGLLVATSSTGSTANNSGRIQLGLGRRRNASFVNTHGSWYRGYSSSWGNSAAAVTSLRFMGTTACSGVIRLYKMAKTQLITTNPNINSLWSKYVDANTVAVQTGEIEINGAIMRAAAPKQVTLSGNLRAGLTEAASTTYFMYAVRPSAGSTPTFMFDTVAPLMDRYGNSVASFSDCTSDRAWFHPTLGLNYRWMGQVRNDASSNILPYDKCMPGYWESAPAAIPAAGDYNLAHGFGRPFFAARIVASETIGGLLYECSNFYYYGTADSYGVLLSNIWASGYAPKTADSLTARIAPNMYRNAAGSWSKAGYYKLILTDK